jgi:anti-sigma factor RsiW
MNLSDELIIAYVDGELPADQRAAVEAAAAADPQAAARLAAHRALADHVRDAYAGIALEPAPPRLVLAASSAPAGATILPFPPRKAQPRMGLWTSGAVAASVALGLVVGRLIWGGGDEWIGQDLRARGRLAQALNTQLASHQASSSIHIGVTFRSADGPLCRTFTVTRGGGFDGLACRRGGDWIVRMAVPPPAAAPGGEYRTAASELPPAVADLAQAMAAGAPLDAAAEAQAKARGWR